MMASPKMGIYLKVHHLASLIRKKRGSRGLREAASDIGSISILTLSRVENGSLPDMETFLALCNWLEVPPSELFGSTSDINQIDTPDAIAIQLRADENLDPAITNVLVVLIKSAYQHFSNQSTDC